MCILFQDQELGNTQFIWEKLFNTAQKISTIPRVDINLFLEEMTATSWSLLRNHSIVIISFFLFF